MRRRSITKILPSIAIFVSGYTPLFLIMVIKDIENFLFYDVPQNWPAISFVKISIPVGLQVSNPSVVLALILLSAISLIMLKYVFLNVSDGSFEIQIIKAKSRSSEVVNYTIPYMISFVAFDLSQWQDIVSLVLFLCVLCLLSIRSQSIFINPILAASGYGLYDCSYIENNNHKECVMLSRHDLMSDSIEEYKKLNNYMGIVKGRDN